MVTYNNLKRDYNMKIDDLTPKEGEHLIESLVRDYYDAYDEDDLEEFIRLGDEIEETMDMLKQRNFTNVHGFTYNTKLFYASSLYRFKLKKERLKKVFSTLETYNQLINVLAFDLYMLHSLLRLYFFTHGDNNVVDVWDDLDIEYNISNVVGEDVVHELHDKYGINPVFMNQMDRIISHLKDSILETQKTIEERFYSPNDSQSKLDFNISNVRNHIHEIIKNDSYRYEREKGLIDIELGMIHAMTIEHELNLKYDELKKEFNKIMRGDDGFSPIVHMFYDDYGKHHSTYEEFEKTYPRYNIGKSRYVPPDSREGNKLFDSYFRLKDRKP